NNEWGTLARGPQIELAGDALRQIAQVMQSATLDKPCTKSADGVWSCGFTSRNTGKILAAWSQQPRTIAIPGGFTRVSNLAGKQGTLKGTVELTSSPVFLLQKEREPLAEVKR